MMEGCFFDFAYIRDELVPVLELVIAGAGAWCWYMVKDWC